MCQWERFQKCLRTIKKIFAKNIQYAKDFKSVPDVSGISIPYKF